jgi:hypothetical protein
MQYRYHLGAQIGMNSVLQKYRVKINIFSDYVTFTKSRATKTYYNSSKRKNT